MARHPMFLLLALASLLATVAGAQATDPRPSLRTAIERHPDLGIFREAIERADLWSAYAGPGPTTVFAPTDGAFEALGEDALGALLADRPRLRRLLELHIVATDIIVLPSGALTSNGSLNPIDRLLVDPASVEGDPDGEAP